MPLKLYLRAKVWHYRGTVAGNRLRGSCKTSDKTIAARQVAEIEAREWKCGFDGPGSVLTFAQAAFLYRAAGKTASFLDRVENSEQGIAPAARESLDGRQDQATIQPSCCRPMRQRGNEVLFVVHGQNRFPGC